MKKRTMVKIEQLNQEWLDRQKKNLTVHQVEFTAQLCFYPCGWDDLTAVVLYGELFGKVKDLQNRWRYNATGYHKAEALAAVKNAWQRVQDHDEEKGWRHVTWEEKFDNMLPVEIMEYLVDAMLSTAYEIEGVSDE